MKICMFVRNDMTRDGRVRREAGALASWGHQVVVFAIPGSGRPAVEELDGFLIKRITPSYKRFSQLGNWLFGHSSEPSLGLVADAESPQKASGTAVAGHVGIMRRSLTKLFFWVVDPHYCKRTIAAAIAEKADVYHAHDLTTLHIAYRASRAVHGKLVYDAHELYLERNSFYADYNFFSNLRLKRRERKLIRKADRVVTINQSIGEELSRRYQIPMPIILMNCPSRFSNTPVNGNKPLRELLQLDAKTPIILYQGTFLRSRGLQNLVLAARYLSRGMVVLLGCGMLEAELKNLIEREKLGQRVRLVAAVAPERLPEFTASADLGVIAYQNDCLNNYYCTPNKLFEYMAAGLPVVASDLPELKRIIAGHRLGRTFNPEDPKSIAAAINSVLSDTARYREMRENSLKAAAIYNWENESKKLREVYQRLELQ